MLMTTSGAIAGRTITTHLGLAKGNTIRARHLGRDIIALLRLLVGGEIQEYTKLMAEAREQALDRMISDASAMGANAIIDVRFSTSVVIGGAAELLAYGTAIVLDEAPQLSR